MSIKELNSIYAFGYGLFIYSPGTFNEWMQEKKCQAKKMLSYFDMHKDMFLEMITKGIALPIYQIPTYQYSIYITTEKDVNIPEDWEQVYLYKDWFITIGTDDKLCFSSFEFFEELTQDLSSMFLIDSRKRCVYDVRHIDFVELRKCLI